jgi:AcrR family transcriptional regulator
MPSTTAPRERIMTVAASLLSAGGQPSVQEIAGAAGISRTTFYRTFPSRAELVEALQLQPAPDAHQRILEAALDMLRTQTLATLSIDELAAAAGVSRANLYRLYPGKAALFRAILITYSPFERVMAHLARSGDRPPDEVVPELVLAAYRTVAGRTGLVRTLLLEVTSMTPETQQAFTETGLRAFGTFAGYLSAQMAAGRLRRLHPLLAVQSLLGGVMFHLLASPVLTRAAVDVPAGEAAVLQFVQVWLRGMRPEA